MDTNLKNSIYLNELMYNCNTYSKGFIYLLEDKIFSLNNYNVKYQKSIVDELIEKYGYYLIDKEKEKYFFTHLHLFFKNNSAEFTKNDQIISIVSSIAAYVNEPLDYIVTILNRFYKNPKIISQPLSTQRFRILFEKQCNSISKDIPSKDYSSQIHAVSFNSDTLHLYSKIQNALENQNDINIFNVINIICDIYKKNIESVSPLPEYVSVNDILDSSDKFIDFSGSDSNLNLTFESEKDKQAFFDNFDKILNDFFNPMDSYLDSAYNKYKEISERITYNSRDCRVIKTILYLATYVLKNKSSSDFKAATYMNKIIESDIGWAVGSENNKKPSFYGESDVAKLLYGYYAYMNEKGNPYAELISNRIVNDMDYNATMISNYFANNGLAYMGFGKEQLYDFYNLLVGFRKIIKVIDSPISLTGTYDNFISGIISSILNSVAISLDFGVSSIVKSLFYAEVIPINKKRYSIANIYNYLNFIKLILESSGDIKNLDYIDRDEFINCAYETLGIDQDSLKKIGYLAYDPELNDLTSINMYDKRLAKNSNNMPFTVKNDLKLLYSLIQFGIQKKAVLNGDPYYQKKVSYGNEYEISSIIESLNVAEIYYIFSIYNINIWTLDDNLGSISSEEIIEFNKKLLFINETYDHNDPIFYKVYSKKDESKIYKELEEYDFENTNYNILISNMMKLYRKILKYNKKQLDTIVFDANDISDIDDFLMRFLPSIIEILKLFGQNADSLQNVAELLDNMLTFISEHLFKNLFVNIKSKIQDLVKQFTEDMFEKLKPAKEEKKEEYNLKIDLNLGESKIVQAIDYLIEAIEYGNFNLFSIQNCFKGNITSVPTVYNDIYTDELIYNFDHDAISREDFIDNNGNNEDYTSTSQNKITIEFVDKITINSSNSNNNSQNNNINSNDNLQNNNSNFIEGLYEPEQNNNMFIEDSTNKTIIDFVDKIKNNIISEKNNNEINNNFISNNNKPMFDNKKIFYNKGNILIEKNNGTIITVVSKNDKNSLDYSYIEYPEIIDKELSQDEYEQLVEIRDYIDNITNKELISLNKQLNKERNNLKQEMSKTKPNYSVIQNINKLIQKLTSAINDVKKENRILTTESSKDETVVIQNFEQNTSNSSENIYSTLDNFFKSKKEILKEVNNIVINNDVILTNYQITELLK